MILKPSLWHHIAQRIKSENNKYNLQLCHNCDRISYNDEHQIPGSPSLLIAKFPWISWRNQTDAIFSIENPSFISCIWYFYQAWQKV